MKKYKFDYDYRKASAEFEVDTELFTDEHANATLTFFLWDYDQEANPVDEVMKKYAIEAIKQATFNNHNKIGVIEDFKSLEGFASIDGSLGITLTDVELLEFEQDDLTVTIE